MPGNTNSNKYFKLSPVPHLASENAENLPLVTTFCHIYANFYGIQHILLTVSLLPAIYHKAEYYLPMVVHIFPSFKTSHHFKYTLNIYIHHWIFKKCYKNNVCSYCHMYWQCYSKYILCFSA